MTKKANPSLLVALALPVVMIVAVALSIFLSSHSGQFKGQFLYAVHENTYWNGVHRYSVMNGKLQEQPSMAIGTIHVSTGTIQLYLHDLSTNVSRRVTPEEAGRLLLDGNQRSSGGLQVEYGNHADGFVPLMFFATTDTSIYVRGNHGSRKLNLNVRDGGFYNDFEFIGWVKS